jgi:hypothetical protein
VVYFNPLKCSRSYDLTFRNLFTLRVKFFFPEIVFLHITNRLVSVTEIPRVLLKVETLPPPPPPPPPPVTKLGHYIACFVLTTVAEFL